MKTAIKPGDKIFFLHRGVYEVHNMNKVVIEMTIVEKNGELKAIEEQQPLPRGFAISPESIEKSNNHPQPHFFDNRAEAEAQFHKEIDQNAQAILDQSANELILEFYRSWVGENVIPKKVHAAMKQKIKTEFGVDVDADES